MIPFAKPQWADSMNKNEALEADFAANRAARDRIIAIFRECGIEASIVAAGAYASWIDIKYKGERVITSYEIEMFESEGRE